MTRGVLAEMISAAPAASEAVVSDAVDLYPVAPDKGDLDRADRDLVVDWEGSADDGERGVRLTPPLSAPRSRRTPRPTPAKTYGLQYVGYYLSTAAVLSLVGLMATRETKDPHL